MNHFWVKVLGSGTAVMDKLRNPAGFWVNTGKMNILMDCGYGVIRRMIDYGQDYQQVEVVIISHFHADHAADVFSLVFARFVEDSYYKRVRGKNLVIIGPKGLEENYKKWRSVFWPTEETYAVEFREKLGEHNFGKVKIKTFEVKHVPYFQSIGIKIEYEGKTLVYTGDIGSDNDMDDLVKRVRGSDLLITEASYPDKTPNHFTFEQIKELRKKAKISRVMVAHISPTQVERIKKECKKDEKMIMAIDGIKVEIERK